MKSQIDNKVIVAIVGGVLLLILVGFFAFGKRKSNDAPSPEMQKMISDPLSQGKGNENGGK